MARTENTATAAPAGFAVVEGGLPTQTRVDPTANPFYEAVKYSQETGQTLSVQVQDMKAAHQQLRRAASALDTGIKIRPSLNSDEGKNVSAENPGPVTFVAGAKRGAGKDAAVES